MAYRPHGYAEGLSEVTTTSTSYSDVVTLTHAAADQVAGADYILFWDAAAQIGDTASDYNLRLTKDGSQAILCNAEAKESSSPIDYDVQSGIYKYTAAGTPVDIVFKIQIACETAAQTAKAKNGHLAWIALTADDYYAESLTRTTMSSSTEASSGATLSFTPPSSGDYVIIAGANLDGSITSTAWMFLTDGTNSSNETGWSPKDTANRWAARMMWRQNGVSGAKTYTLMHRSDVAGQTIGSSEKRLLALRVDGFDNVYSTELGANNEGTQATYQTALSQTFTPVANDHLTLAAWRARGSVNTITSYVQFVDDGTTLTEGYREPNLSPGNFAGAVGKIAAYTASSRTQTIQRQSETTSTTTRIGAGASIISFDLGAAPGGYTLAANGATLALTSPAVGLKVSRVLPAAGRTLALTGQAVSLRRGYTLAAQGRSLSLSAGAVGLIVGRKLVAQGRNLTLTGQAVTLSLTRKLAAQGASLSLSGQAVALKVSRKLVAGGATLSLAAQPVTLTYTPAAIGYTLAAGGLTLALVGGSVALRVARRLTANGVTLTLTGGSATFALGSAPILAYPVLPGSATAGTISGRTTSAAPIAGQTANAGTLPGSTSIIANPVSGRTIQAP
jgi:hypothetical protein